MKKFHVLAFLLGWLLALVFSPQQVLGLFKRFAGQ